jgi:uncharacterized protein YbjT (DUF2867 family)
MTPSGIDLAGTRLLVTGPTGQVAGPVVAAYAKTAEVFALARFHRDEDAARIRALGAVPIQADLADPASLRAVPRDVG